MAVQLKINMTLSSLKLGAVTRTFLQLGTLSMFAWALMQLIEPTDTTCFHLVSSHRLLGLCQLRALLLTMKNALQILKSILFP